MCHNWLEREVSLKKLETKVRKRKIGTKHKKEIWNENWNEKQTNEKLPWKTEKWKIEIKIERE